MMTRPALGPVTIRQIQERLTLLGHRPGPIDGAWGPRTEAAVRAFQSRRGLVVDGVVGPITTAALMGYARTPPDPVWLGEAERRLGLHETHDNGPLWDWLKSGGASVGNPARVPWCGDFVETCIARTLREEPLPANPFWARNWSDWGRSCGPIRGAVASYTRGRAGHVGFLLAHDPIRNRDFILGGNQSNAVTRIWIDGSRRLAWRWPISVPIPAGAEVSWSSAGAELSTNEA